jgi:hypothetical protein
VKVTNVAEDGLLSARLVREPEPSTKKEPCAAAAQAADASAATPVTLSSAPALIDAPQSTPTVVRAKKPKSRKDPAQIGLELEQMPDRLAASAEDEDWASMDLGEEWRTA